MGQAGGQEPDRFGQGPRRVLHGGPGGEGRPAPAGLGDPGAHLREHRYLPGHGGQAARLPPDRGHAREHQRGAPPAAPDVRRRDHRLARRRRLQRGGPGGQADRLRAPRLDHALPVRQRGQRPRPLRDDRPGDPGRPARDHPLRGRPRHHRHAHGRGPLPARAQARRQDRGGRAALRRARLRPAQRGRGLRPRTLRRVRADHPVLGIVGRRAAPDPGADLRRGHLRGHLDRRRRPRRPGPGGQGGGRGRARRHRDPGRRRRLEIPVHRRLFRHPRRSRSQPRRPALGIILPLASGPPYEALPSLVAPPSLLSPGRAGGPLARGGARLRRAWSSAPS